MDDSKGFRDQIPQLIDGQIELFKDGDAPEDMVEYLVENKERMQNAITTLLDSFQSGMELTVAIGVLVDILEQFNTHLKEVLNDPEKIKEIEALVEDLDNLKDAKPEDFIDGGTGREN